MATRVNFETESYEGEALNAGELNLLREQLMMLAGSSALLRVLFQENQKRIEGAAEVAKNLLGAPFRGLSSADSEFGFQLIRPQHVRRTTAATEATAETWNFTFTANADYWLGFGTDNTTALNIDKRALVVPLGVAFTNGGQPLVEELLLQVGATTFPVVVLRHAWLADNANQVRFVPIRPNIWIPKQTVLGQVYSYAAGDNQLVLLGITFAKGDLLRAQNPTAIQT